MRTNVLRYGYGPHDAGWRSAPFLAMDRGDRPGPDGRADAGSDRLSVSFDGIVCFASTDCRGGVVESDAVESGGDCCANIGLSFCDGEGCRNCFRECSLVQGVRGAALSERVKGLR